MTKKVVQTDHAPAAIGPYSQAIWAGDTLYCSGQIALDPKSGQMLNGSVVEQAQLVMKNIEGLLNAAGVNFSHVVKSTIFLTTMNDFAAVNEVYSKSFPSAPPARSTVAVSGLPKGALVEIEVVAHRA